MKGEFVKPNLRKLFREWIVPYTLLAVVLWLLSHYVFFITFVPSGSMIPTILEYSALVATRVHNPETLERGDIVVFQSDELGKLLVKRLIGLPGETVSVDEQGQVTIDGKLLQEPYVKHYSPVTGEFAVPERQYLFMGDNRKGSFDGRSWQQPYISEDKIEGRAVFTLWPVSNFGPLQ